MKIQIHKDAINENDIVLLHDDLLATWGTMKAAENLVKKFNPKKIYINFLIEITDEWLHWRDLFKDSKKGNTKELILYHKDNFEVFTKVMTKW